MLLGCWWVQDHREAFSLSSTVRTPAGGTSSASPAGRSAPGCEVERTPASDRPPLESSSVTVSRQHTDSGQLERSILQIKVSRMSSSHVSSKPITLAWSPEPDKPKVCSDLRELKTSQKTVNLESKQDLQLRLLSVCFSATLNGCQVWRASSRRDGVTRPQIRTDPNKVSGSQRGAAGASGLAVDIHAVPLLSVLQGKLHASVQVLQAGNAGEVNGGQPQLLHARSPPLLPPHYKQMQSVGYTQLQYPQFCLFSSQLSDFSTLSHL